MKLVCLNFARSQSCPGSRYPRLSSPTLPLALILLALSLAVITGCGGGGMHSVTPPPQGNTQVTFLLSTAADDHLSQYELNFQDLTLTSQSGKVVSVLTTAPNAAGPYTPEFMHLNSEAATLLTATVPDDTYTSATLTVGGASLTCISVDPSDGSLTTSIFAYGQTPQSQVTVNLPSPIVVNGSTMNLSMRLQMPQSYTLDSCIGGSTLDAYTITPTFNLAVADLSASPTNYLNGKENDILGQVSATTSSGFSVTEGYNPNSPSTLSVQNITVNSSTVYQGIRGLSAVTEGTFVDMDLVAQPDGSLIATRVAVQDPNAVDTAEGPLVFVTNEVPSFFLFGQQVQGSDLIGNSMPFDISQGVFKISGQFTNLSTLPFTPVFNASNLVAGQNVYVTTPKLNQNGIYGYPLLNTVTLMPQTVQGSIDSISSSGDFSIYTITVASYNLFSDLAGQAAGSNLIANPSQIVIYADSKAQVLNQAEPSVGSTMRVHGLVFNDQGTLRMDCDEVDSGVLQTSQPSNQTIASSRKSQSGATTVESTLPTWSGHPARLRKTTLFPKIP